MYYLNIFDRVNSVYWFLRTEFICIIWTFRKHYEVQDCSWGLNLFVLFELIWSILVSFRVLEDWIYLYYLNSRSKQKTRSWFLRTEFICIIWTQQDWINKRLGSWGLNLFVLFELKDQSLLFWERSWGLNLFVLFEHIL